MIHSNILTFIGYSAEAKFSEYISLQHPIVTVYRFQMDIVFLLSPIEREKKSHWNRPISVHRLEISFVSSSKQEEKQKYSLSSSVQIRTRNFLLRNNINPSN